MMSSEFERHLLSSSSTVNPDADEFFNTQATDDHILERGENQPLSNNDNDDDDQAQAQLTQEWLNKPAQRRRKSLKDFRKKMKNKISTIITKTIPLNEALINKTVTNFCMVFAVFTSTTLGLHFDVDHVIRLINNSREKKLLAEAEGRVKIEDPYFVGLTFKRPGAGNWSKAYENDLCMYVESQHEFATFLQERIETMKNETSLLEEIRKRIEGIQKEIASVNGKLLGMGAQMFEPDCLSFSNEIRKQKIIDNSNATTRLFQDNIDIESLIPTIRAFVSSNGELLGLLEEELEEKKMRETRIQECFDHNFNCYFQNIT